MTHNSSQALESDSFSDKNTQGETNSVRVRPQRRATIISRWFLWSGSTGSRGSGSGRPGPGRLLGQDTASHSSPGQPLNTRGESAAARRRVLAITGTDGAHYRLLRPCEQLFTRITCALFTLGEMLRVTRTRSRQVIGCTEKTTDQSARPARNVEVTIWFKSVYKDILVG